MISEDEKKYFEHKKKTVIDIVNVFQKWKGYRAFPFQLNQDTLDLEEQFCNPKLCSSCGSCCSVAPCVFSPYDFLDLCNLDYMRNILNTGLVCISRSSLDYETLVLRPRGKKDTESIVSTIYDYNHCILENGKGCMLPVQYRPCQGLLYIPRCDNGFVLHTILYSDYLFTYDYKQFQNILKDLAHEYYNKPVPSYKEITEEDVNGLVKSLIKSK